MWVTDPLQVTKMNEVTIVILLVCHAFNTKMYSHCSDEKDKKWKKENFVLMMSKWVWFVYLGFYVAFNTVQVISRRVVGRAKETST